MTHDVLVTRARGGDRSAYFLARTGRRIGVRAVQRVVTALLNEIDEDADGSISGPTSAKTSVRCAFTWGMGSPRPG